MGCLVSFEDSRPRSWVGTASEATHPSPSTSLPFKSSNSSPPPPSSSSLSIYSLLPSLLPFKESFQDLFLAETDLARLYALYKLVKHSKEDRIDKKKFIDYFNFQDSLFALRIVNHQNLVSIFDMILLLWHFCTIGKHLGHPLALQLTLTILSTVCV
jgi:hypothetical protein